MSDKQPITMQNKVHAYNDAAAFLDAQESESDEPGDKEAREWLAEKMRNESYSLKVRIALREAKKGTKP